MIREMETLQRRMAEAMFRDLGSFDEMVERGELEGGWRVQPFEGPGMRGFIARGYFRTPEPLRRPGDLSPPLGPPRREPLYDVSEGEAAVRLYIELPGVERKEIEIETEPNGLEVSARDFHAVIGLPVEGLDMENLATEYRNGVLTVTIPRIGDGHGAKEK